MGFAIKSEEGGGNPVGNNKATKIRSKTSKALLMGIGRRDRQGGKGERKGGIKSSFVFLEKETLFCACACAKDATYPNQTNTTQGDEKLLLLLFFSRQQVTAGRAGNGHSSLLGVRKKMGRRRRFLSRGRYPLKLKSFWGPEKSKSLSLWVYVHSSSSS